MQQQYCEEHYDAEITKHPAYCELCKLKARIKELEGRLRECKTVSNAHCLQAENYRVELTALRKELKLEDTQ
jgi:hypothetical protein